MKARRLARSHSTRNYYWATLSTKAGLRLALVVLISVSVLALITALALAQKQEKVLQAETRATPANGIERPRKSAAERKDTRKRKSSRNSDQEQQLASQSQEGRGEHDRGERKPREFHMRRARPFTGDLRQ